MFEEHFDRIERKLTELDSRLESGFADVSHRFEEVNSRFEAVDRRFGAVDQRFEALTQHMHVLHEDVIGRIAAIPDNTARLEARMDRGFADLKEMIGRRLDPLEAAMRHHTIEIERLKRDRAT